MQDADGQSGRRAAAVHLRPPGRGNAYPLLLGQRGEKLDHEQRVARGPRHPARQPRARWSAGQPPGQRQRRLGVERAQVEPDAPVLAGGVDHGRDRLPVGRPRGGQDQRRVLRAQAGESAKHGQARAVSPVQIVDDQDEFGRRAQRLEYADERVDQVVDLHRDVLKAPGPGLVPLDSAAQFGQGRVGGMRRDPQRVADRAERPGLLELADLRRSHGHAPRPGLAGDLADQAGLADSGAALHDHRAAVAVPGRREPAADLLELPVPADQIRPADAGRFSPL